MTYNKKTAFTLAEVLITLGIIGVVAALTMPALTAKYRKHVVETKLMKFYSNINQAIRLSEIENGDKKGWDIGICNPSFPGTISQIDWYNKYLKKYIKAADVKIGKDGKAVLAYQSDGSLFVICGEAVEFYTDAGLYEAILDEDGNYIDRSKKYSGTKLFNFKFKPIATNSLHDKGVEPFYPSDKELTTEELKSDPALGCRKEMPSNMRGYCTALIQRNGWKVPNDYPLKF